MVGFVSQVLDLRQLLVAHLCRNLLEHLTARYLVRQRRNHDIAVLDFVGGTQAQCAASGFINLLDVLARRYEFTAGRIIRSLDVLHQRGDRRLW